MGTVVDDAFQTLNDLDQRGHVGDFIQWWGLQLREQGTDLTDAIHRAVRRRMEKRLWKWGVAAGQSEVRPL